MGEFCVFKAWDLLSFCLKRFRTGPNTGENMLRALAEIDIGKERDCVCADSDVPAACSSLSKDRTGTTDPPAAEKKCK